MNRQYTGWGYVDWLTPEMDEQKISLNVGIVCIAPHAHMNAHIHFAEQVIYTLQGEGYSLIDGEKVDMSEENVILHWKAGIIHEMYNTGDTVFKHLMVSCPEAIRLDAINDTVGPRRKITEQEATEYLYEAINATRAQFVGTLHYSYIILEASGNLATCTRVFPAYCCVHCDQELMTKSAACMQANVAAPVREEGKFVCPHGLTALYVPILFQDAILGYVVGGFVHTSVTDCSMQEGVYVTPQSSIQGIQLLLRRIAKSMVSFCEFYRFKNDLVERDRALLNKQEYQEVLIANLKHAENSMTDLQINNHFLFNTLNQMASMALEGGVLPLYQSILDLSKLFNYTLRNNNNTVTLDKEFEYLKAYLQLQKLRYEERLLLHYEVEPDLSRWQVPFNFLMPIAENAFTHGFGDVAQKRLSVFIGEEGDALRMVIANNGVILDEATRGSIMQGMRSGAAHGLSMVYRKLRSAYGDRFALEILSDDQEGTKVSITIPHSEVSR